MSISEDERKGTAHVFRHAVAKGWKTLEDFRGLHRDRVVVHLRIRRPDDKEYHDGYEAEGYAGVRSESRARLH